MIKTHTGIVVVETALGKIRKTVKLYRSEKAWVVSARESTTRRPGVGIAVRAGQECCSRILSGTCRYLRSRPVLAWTERKNTDDGKRRTLA